MHDQPGAEQLGTIATSQLATIAGGVTSPSYRLPDPCGSFGWHLPSQPAPHAPGHPPAPHAPGCPAPPPACHPPAPPTCHPPATPTLPYLPMRPGSYGSGFNPWGLTRA